MLFLVLRFKTLGKLGVLLTGVTGFVGAHLARGLKRTGQFEVTGVVRSNSRELVSVDRTVSVCAFTKFTDWSDILKGQDIVIHSAARVHIMDDRVADPLGAFREVNVEGTMALARQAATAGVRRFLFISSVKVNGEQTDHRPPFLEDDQPSPEDPYGISKHEAEKELELLARETNMEVTIIRPPLIYGPDVKGNFASLLKIANSPLPLPFGAVFNQRSLLYIGNLVDFVIHAISHPAAGNQTFLVSDGQDLSTTELLKSIRKTMGRKARLVPVPFWMFRAVAELLGKRAFVSRLYSSLQVDSSKAERLLGWRPRYSVVEGLSVTAEDFLNRSVK